jgi:hypothetical protein
MSTTLSIAARRRSGAERFSANGFWPIDAVSIRMFPAENAHKTALRGRGPSRSTGSINVAAPSTIRTT